MRKLKFFFLQNDHSIRFNLILSSKYQPARFLSHFREIFFIIDNGDVLPVSTMWKYLINANSKPTIDDTAILGNTFLSDTSFAPLDRDFSLWSEGMSQSIAPLSGNYGCATVQKKNKNGSKSVKIFQAKVYKNKGVKLCNTIKTETHSAARKPSGSFNKQRNKQLAPAAAAQRTRRRGWKCTAKDRTFSSSTHAHGLLRSLFMAERFIESENTIVTVKTFRSYASRTSVCARGALLLYGGLDFSNAPPREPAIIEQPSRHIYELDGAFATSWRPIVPRENSD